MSEVNQRKGQKDMTRLAVVNEGADVFALPVHPWADRFPMRSPEDLASMAESIKANGLRMPVVLGMAVPDGADKPTLCVIDGRNRREACRIAGIEPHTITLNGEDQDAYIADMNFERRDMTKAQKAMLLAVRYPKGPRGRGAVDPARRGTAESGKDGDSPSFNRVQKARLVNELCPEMVEAIIAGKQGLDEAVAEAQRRRSAAQSEEARFEKLKMESPDLADKVVDGVLKLDDALGAARARAEELRRQQQGMVQGIQSFCCWAYLFNANNRATLVSSCRAQMTSADIEEMRRALCDLGADLDATAKEFGNE
jgi:hypothetical protein